MKSNINKREVSFSIVVPVYNAASYLKECLESILSQTLQHFEIILINDGSQDESLKIIKDFAKKDSRLIVINQKNAGVSAARNAGLSKATGEYIIFVDADDYIIDINMLEELNSALRTSPDVVMYNIFYENKPVSYPLPSKLYTKSKEGYDDFLYYMIKDEHINSPCNKVYKREIIHKNKLRFDEKIKIGEDLLFNIQYLTNCQAIRYLNRDFYFYRTSNGGSITSTYMKHKYDDLMTVQKALSEWVEPRKNARLDNIAKYILLKNIFSCIRDTQHLSKAEQHTNLLRFKADHPKIHIKHCGTKLWLVSLLYSLVNIHVIAKVILLAFPAKKGYGI